MPCTIVRNSTGGGNKGAQSTVKAANTFTGDVWMDKLAGPVDGLMCNHVTFLPGSRTYWHHHENGQILEVKAGSGWVCDKGGKPERISVGDIVQCPAGTIHWHGADEGSMMMHLAISLGKTTVRTVSLHSTSLSNAGISRNTITLGSVPTSQVANQYQWMEEVSQEDYNSKSG